MKAITGKDVFYYHEYLRLMLAEEIVIAHTSAARSANWAEWAVSNPRLAEVLNEAAQLYDEMTNA